MVIPARPLEYGPNKESSKCANGCRNSAPEDCRSRKHYSNDSSLEVFYGITTSHLRPPTVQPPEVYQMSQPEPETSGEEA